MKKIIPLFKVIAAAVALILEFLPWGVQIVYKWPDSDSGKFISRTELHSYVDPVVSLGCADFFAPLTVLFTVAILIISIIGLLKSRQFEKLLFTLSFIATLLSLPVMNVSTYTGIGFAITMLMVFSVFINFDQLKGP